MEDNKFSRRTFLKKSGRWMFNSFLAGLAGYSYVKFIEPRWIETTRHQILHPLIPQSFDGFKIVQFSDTHVGFHFDLSRLQNIVQKIKTESPDIIIFSGDLVDNLLSYFEVEDTIIILSSLHAPYGKFAVYGNHDHGGWGSEKYQYIMESSGFSLLKNETFSITMGNKDKIILAGVDDAMLGKPDFTQMKDLQKDIYSILISHAPDLADEAVKFPFHLQLSGHTHGGQVQIPFFGPLITPPYGKKYFEGFYQISDRFVLYVNRGLGTTRLPYRFFSRPEISIFTLKRNHQIEGGS